ncbi:hypothetical protein COOONC_04315 [Cooperia oncophora]
MCRCVACFVSGFYRWGATIANIRKFWPRKKILVYNLGLNQGSVEKLEKKCLVEVRGFPFSSYPSHVANLNEYRWKPLIIASGYVLQTPSGHSIFATTDPGVYKYFPTVFDNLKSTSCENYDANFAFIVRTKDTVDILRWLVLCALERDCMAPPGSQLVCKFGNDRYTRYAGCHRYDQSVINLLLANSYGYNPRNYVSRFGAKGVKIEKICLILINC